MEAARAIKYGDAEALRVNEHQIIYEIELRCDDCSIEYEDYMTYWIASHKDNEAATEMFEVFMNTCSTVFNLDASEEIMELYSYPTMVGAIANENIDIIEYVMGYQGKDALAEEIYAQYGDEEYWPESLLTWYRRTFS
jgi:hypothetical protein